MKRTPMPPRTAPLRHDPERIRAWRQRSARIKSKGAKVKREASALDAMRYEVRSRSHGFCEAQTPACPPYRHEGHHVHHCAPSDRDRGIHDPERALLLCVPAHDWTHQHPAVAYENGWLIRDGVA